MIEHEAHSPAHHTGLPWLDLILAGSAIFISVVSLIVSIHHGNTMEKLVAANEKQVKASTLPLLRFSTGNMDEANKVATVHFDLANGGTGPAIIEWMRIKWNGRPTSGPQGLVDECCKTGPPKPSRIFQNNVSGMTLPASQSVTLFNLAAADADHELYQRLNLDARFKVEAEACYCSVLDECWITDFKSRPKDVKACEQIPEKEKW